MNTVELEREPSAYVWFIFPGCLGILGLLINFSMAAKKGLLSRYVNETVLS